VFRSPSRSRRARPDTASSWSCCRRCARSRISRSRSSPWSCSASAPPRGSPRWRYSTRRWSGASIIVGAVGGGGIGTELVGALSTLDFHRTLTIVIVLVALVAGVDSFGMLARRLPRTVLLLLPVGLIALWLNRPQLFALGHALHTFAGMVPPQLRAEQIVALPLLIAQTLAIAAGGTLLGAVLALPVSLVAAQRLAPFPVVVVVRRLLDVARAIPELVFGLILVVSIGIGPLAGAIALGLHSAGVLGKLYAESFENVPVAPIAPRLRG